MSNQTTDTPSPADVEKVLKEHLEAPADLLEHLSNVMIRWYQEEEFILYDGPRDKMLLADMSLALRSLDRRNLSQLSAGAQRLLDDQLSLNVLGTKTVKKNNTESGTHHLKNMLAELSEAAQELRSHVDAVLREIETSDRTKRSLKMVKLDRLHLVDIAVDYWGYWGRGDVPRAEIKDHQPFARFLGDLADLFGVETSASKAQHSWLDQKGHVPPLKRN